MLSKHDMSRLAESYSLNPTCCCIFNRGSAGTRETRGDLINADTTTAGDASTAAAVAADAESSTATAGSSTKPTSAAKRRKSSKAKRSKAQAAAAAAVEADTADGTVIPQADSIQSQQAQPSAAETADVTGAKLQHSSSSSSGFDSGLSDAQAACASVLLVLLNGGLLLVDHMHFQVHVPHDT
jgi:cobalamin biosynthesis Mg chelatase CobN